MNVILFICRIFKNMRPLNLIALSIFFVTTLCVGCKAASNEDVRELIVKGKVALQNDKRQEAKKLFEKAVNKNKNSSEALFELARILAAENNWPLMEHNVKLLLNIDADHFDGRLLLANYYMGAGKIVEAKKHVNYLLVLQPENREVLIIQAAIELQQKKPEKASEILKKLIEKNPKDTEVLYLLAWQYHQQKKIEDALMYINLAIDVSPEDYSSNLLKIDILKQLNRTEETAAIYQWLIKVYPEKSEPVVAFAMYQAQKGNIEGSISLFETFAKQNSQPAFYGRAIELIANSQGPKAAEEKLLMYLNQSPSPDLNILLADIYAQTGRIKLAEVTLPSLDDLEVTNLQKIEILSRRARYAISNNELESASTFVEQGLSLNSADANLLAIKATLLLKNGKANEAISLLLPLVESSKSIELFMTLASAYELDRQWSLAQRYYEKAARQPNVNSYQLIRYGEFLINREQFKKAEKVLTPLIRSGSNDPKALELFTRLKLAKKEWNVALKLTDELEMQTGKTIVSLKLRALAYIGDNQKKPAYENLRKMYSLIPGDTSAMSSMVQAYLTFNDVNEAKQFLNIAVKKNENPYFANLLLGQIAESRKQLEEAQSAYTKAMSIDNLSPEAHKALIALYLNSGQTAAAENALATAIQLVPEKIGFQLKLASLYSEDKDFSKAIEIYQAILESNSEVDLAANNLAVIYTQQGGVANLEKAARLTSRFRQSDIPEFLDTLGWVYVVQGKIYDALPILQRAVQKNPKNAEMQFHLGFAYYKASNYSLAGESLNRALSLAKSASPAWTSEAEKILKDIGDTHK